MKAGVAAARVEFERKWRRWSCLGKVDVRGELQLQFVLFKMMGLWAEPIPWLESEAEDASVGSGVRSRM